MQARPALALPAAIAAALLLAACAQPGETAAPAAPPAAAAAASTADADPVAYCRRVGDQDVQPDRGEVQAMTEAVNHLVAPDNALWRCMGGKVMVCRFGANAHQCQRNPNGLAPTASLRRWCAGNPAGRVPNYANDTSLDWNCRGKAPVLTRSARLDGRGYRLDAWTPLEKART